MSDRNKMQYTIHVNEEKGIVAVRVTNGVQQLRDEYVNFCVKYGVFNPNYLDNFISKYGKQIDKLVGIASCNREGGDEFDIEFGVNLARERVMACFESYRTKFYTELCLRLDHIAELASIRAERSDSRRFERFDRINELIESLKD